MKKTLYLFYALVLTAGCVKAQGVSEKTGLRLYEHHSTDMTQAPFGNDANGAQSGYDFVNHRYYNSFDQTTYGAYTQGEETNLDMVEHNGPFGTNGANMYLGFTSGSSTIWNGAIKGNEETKWMKAPNGFDYSAVNSVTDISSAYNASTASYSVAEVNVNDVYIGKIRNSSMYVVLKCIDRLAPMGSNPQGQTANVYFDFSYKYGGTFTGIAPVKKDLIAVHPNPAKDLVFIDLPQGNPVKSLKIYSITGAEVSLHPGAFALNKLDVRSLTSGIYFLHITASNGQTFVTRLTKQPL